MRSQTSLMEGKHGTACQRRLIGTWPTTGDGGRVDQLFHTGADEGDAEQVVAVVIDDPAGSAGLAVGVQAGVGHRLAGADVDHADAVPGAFGLVGDEPDGPRREGRRRIPAVRRGGRR
jgi:hypothetical protein